MRAFSLAEGTLTLRYTRKKRRTLTHWSSLEMVMQMVEKLWHILPTSCACTLGKKSRTKQCEASRSSSFSLYVDFAIPHKTVVNLSNLYRLLCTLFSLYQALWVSRWTFATSSRAIRLRSNSASFNVPLSLWQQQTSSSAQLWCTDRAQLHI